MDQEIWQQLLSLESRDITQQWYFKLHGRELNVRRAKEINAAAKQSREYFRNAYNSNYTVRPLLTYYGVASLSRSFLLLLKREGGEEGLAGGHGLTTVNWSEHLTGGIPRHFQAFSTPEQNPALGVLSTPAHPQVTLTVGQGLNQLLRLRIIYCDRTKPYRTKANNY